MACTPHLPHGATLRRPSMLSSLRLARQLITWPQPTAISFIPSLPKSQHAQESSDGMEFIFYKKKNLGWMLSIKKEKEKNLGWNGSTALLRATMRRRGPRGSVHGMNQAHARTHCCAGARVHQHSPRLAAVQVLGAAGALKAGGARAHP